MSVYDSRISTRQVAFNGRSHMRSDVTRASQNVRTGQTCNADDDFINDVILSSSRRELRNDQRPKAEIVTLHHLSAD